ncbi:unnamed protein product [Amoebophrya sp. A120]|nr:unnamed protein product [Amoebophrya sp. A120]|eukprot:GSA120T00022993001.1
MLDVQDKLYTHCGFFVEFLLGQEEYAVHNSRIGTRRILHRTITGHTNYKQHTYLEMAVGIGGPRERSLTMEELRRLDFVCAIHFDPSLPERPVVGIFIFPKSVAENYLRSRENEKELVNAVSAGGGSAATVELKPLSWPRHSHAKLRQQEQTRYYIDLRSSSHRDANVARAKQILACY